MKDGLKQHPGVNAFTRFDPVNPGAVCPYMKMVTPTSLLRCLREGTTEITLDPDVARRAAAAVQRMVAIGASCRGGE